MQRSYPFAHRFNQNETIDSICKTCSRIVGTAETATALTELEAAHKCDKGILDLIKGTLSEYLLFQRKSRINL